MSTKPAKKRDRFRDPGYKPPDERVKPQRFYGTVEEHREWKLACMVDGYSFSSWVRKLLNDRAAELLGSHPAGEKVGKKKPYPRRRR